MSDKPLVAVIMGSKSDWDTMSHASETLAKFGVAHESRVMSAHRSPALTSEYATTAEVRGIEVIIAAAGGAAHLAGVFAAHTLVPVLGVPMESQSLKGLDSLALHRPNARRDSRRHARHRQTGRNQRRTPGDRDSG